MDASNNANTAFNQRYWALKRSQEQSSSVASPPPAYTPRRLAAISVTQTGQDHSRDSATLLNRSPRASCMVSGCGDDADINGQPEGFSPISLRINTSVVVTKSNNLVCIAATPTEHANSIAKAVVRAIQENSSGQCGLPMVDEDGRPRPVNIEVDASMMVDGPGNVVGDESVINEVLRQRQGSWVHQRKGAGEDGEQEPVGKRRRPST